MDTEKLVKALEALKRKRVKEKQCLADVSGEGASISGTHCLLYSLALYKRTVTKKLPIPIHKEMEVKFLLSL